MNVQQHNNDNNNNSGISDGLRGIRAQQWPEKNVTVNNMFPLYWLQPEQRSPLQPPLYPTLPTPVPPHPPCPPPRPTLAERRDDLAANTPPQGKWQFHDKYSLKRIRQARESRTRRKRRRRKRRRRSGPRRGARRSSAQRPAVADNERRMTPPAIRLAARRQKTRRGEHAVRSGRAAKWLRKIMFCRR